MEEDNDDKLTCEIWQKIMLLLNVEDLHALILTNNTIYGYYLDGEKYNRINMQLHFLHLNQYLNFQPERLNANHHDFKSLPVESLEELSLKTLIPLFPCSKDFGYTNVKPPDLPSTMVQSFEEFQMNLNNLLKSSYHSRTFNNHLFDIGFVIGGSLIWAALQKNGDMDKYKDSDVDYYLIQQCFKKRFLKDENSEMQNYYLKHPSQAFRKVFLEKIKPKLNYDKNLSSKELDEEMNKKNYLILKSDPVINLVPVTGRTLQIVTKLKSTVSELVHLCDLDCTKFAYDGHNVYTNRDGLVALFTNCNVVPKHLDTEKYEFKRVIKYQERNVYTIFHQIHPLHHLLPIEQYIKIINTKKNNHNKVNYTDKVNSPAFKRVDKFADYENVLENLDYYMVKSLAKNFKDHTLYNNMEEMLMKNVSEYFDYQVNDSYIRRYFMIRKCYICSEYSAIYKDSLQRLLSHVYDNPDVFLNELNENKISVCDRCRKFNDENRNTNKDLKGYNAVVTGGRIKIGYSVVLKLLRSGANVIATTRFPNNAYTRFTKENDYNNWKDRLDLYPLDLKSAKLIMEFVKYLKENYDKIHILVNNAAQTIRRPIDYYSNIIHNENESIKFSKNILKDTNDNPNIDKNDETVVNDILTNPYSSLDDEENKKQNYKSNVMKQNNINQIKNQTSQNKSITLVWSEHQLSHYENKEKLHEWSIKETLSNQFEDESTRSFIPLPNKFDRFGEPFDNRSKNSWTMKIDEIHPIEMVETQMINNLAPTLLVSKMLNLMSPFENLKHDGKPSHIINVTSNEGQFNTKFKTNDHVHNNISKAALNMLTRSSAQYFATKGVLMNSVDTGWISSSNDTYLQPALTCDDGAARILHPIMTNCVDYGCLFKNYKNEAW